MRIRRVITLLLVAIVGVAASMSTASANSPAHDGAFGTTFVDGAGPVTDDWGDHFSELGHSLCNGCADSSNTDLVLMWQAVLFSEGFIGRTDLDGNFGPRTEAATRSWQSRYIGGSGVDGRVGNQTWSRADDFLLYLDNTSNLYYTGFSQGKVVFERGVSPTNSGAYELVCVIPPQGGVCASIAEPSGNFIQFHSRTITFSTS